MLGDFAVGLGALAIVGACVLYVRGWGDSRPFAFRAAFRRLRAARALRELLTQAVESVRERI